MFVNAYIFMDKIQTMITLLEEQLTIIYYNIYKYIYHILFFFTKLFLVDNNCMYLEAVYKFTIFAYTISFVSNPL